MFCSSSSYPVGHENQQSCQYIIKTNHQGTSTNLKQIYLERNFRKNENTGGKAAAMDWHILFAK